MKIILLLHRYVGAVMGLVMTLWCLSGFVMMYQGYPKVTDQQRLAGLQPLELARGPANAATLPGLGAVDGLAIEMLAGRPVLRLSTPAGARIMDLGRGEALGPITPSAALTTARIYAVGHALQGAPRTLRLIDEDQWTVEGAAARGPVYRIGLSDPARTTVYVAQRTGVVVQATTRASRFWGWIGAVPHWLYPTLLRRDTHAWSTVVIWAALTGCFLTLTGLYVGIARFRRYNSGRWSPYRGWHYWHHIMGLVFGVLTLTWVASGLFSVNPWGFLDTSVGEAEQASLRGEIAASDLQRFLMAAPGLARGGVVAFEAAPFGGRLFVLERFADGRIVRLDASGAPAPLGRDEVARALTRLEGPPVAELSLLGREDAYYYTSFDHDAPLPAWRASTAGPERRTFYLDAATGEMTLALDSTARASRWIRTGLHDLDFPGLRARPLWDVVVLVLLAGVTGVCATGAWIGLKRLAHDLGRLRRLLRSRSAG